MADETAVEPMIGIFWQCSDRILGVKCPIRHGDENVPGLVDSPFDHVEEWERLSASDVTLRGTEYDDIPRGRVLFDRRAKRVIVYGDRAYFGEGAGGQPLAAVAIRNRRLIAGMFYFDVDRSTWMHDLHYTVGRDRISRLFD